MRWSGANASLGSARQGHARDSSSPPRALGESSALHRTSGAVPIAHPLLPASLPSERFSGTDLHRADKASSRTHSSRESVTKAGIQGQTLRRPSLGPRFRVVFRVISKGLRRGLIGQASQSGAVIVINEAQDEGIALLMGIELASGVDIFPGAQRLGEASVEALNHAIGLRSERFGQPMFGVERVAGLVKRGGVRTVDLRACSSCRRRSGR
jgi:hypothetical protein